MSDAQGEPVRASSGYFDEPLPVAAASLDAVFDEVLEESLDPESLDADSFAPESLELESFDPESLEPESFDPSFDPDSEDEEPSPPPDLRA